MSSLLVSSSQSEGSGKRYFSWADIQKSIQQSSTRVMNEFKPTVLVAITGGGMVPARILRTCVKAKTGKNLPIQCIGLVLYDDDDVMQKQVQRTQWLSPDFDISGHNVLLVDEVDDSRTTLAFAVDEMLRYFQEMRDQAEASGKGAAWKQPNLGVYVIHNKLRDKVPMSNVVYPHNYFAQDLPNRWHVYPWDALDIDLHEVLAKAQNAQENGVPIFGNGMQRRPSNASLTGLPPTGSPTYLSLGSPTLKGFASSLTHGSPAGGMGVLRGASCMSKNGSHASLNTMAEEVSNLASSFKEASLLV
ncbi:hypothetical protein CEUSTIGMA_g9362.t1 [Chlamydomonas eustigma]|uniref:Phosphoribosyltransferase domain-containing protein n=1 Tax=Chlamydomonas eustigma TaxID=1157962 RepID=A0A250XFS9_9CHLO|nr:hypothetical protein CEUSTIGMA_g9362.t1 [Chlamydomonas eustigma]|eukprot:GAX81934.1 hypothetical protein CEUSTIGMA_g9362.t1 [Chlamydomonas eustigma]